MSTLRLTTISNQSGSASVPSDTVINGSAKAWVNFNGTGTVEIRGNFNVSSITDNGTGDYTLNFANAMPNANYAVTGAICLNSLGGNFGGIFTPAFNQLPTTSNIRIQCAQYNGIAYDYEHVFVAVFR